MQKSLFFGIIGLFIAIATILQFWLYSRLDTLCTDNMLGLSPSVAGGCLAVSFLTNISWVVAKRKQWLVLERISLFVWVVVISTGLIAVGATLGQSQLYKTVCPDFTEAMKEVDVNLLQYVSIALLILSVATPHIYSNKTAKVATDTTTIATAVTGSEEFLSSNPLKPLIFL